MNLLSKKFYKESWFFEAIMEQNDISIIVTNIEGEIVFVNMATVELFGYSKEEFIGANPFLVNAEPNAVEIQEDIIQTVSADKVWKGRIKNKKKNGEIFLIDITVKSLKNEDGDISAFIGYQKDVSEIASAKEHQFFSDARYLSIFQSAPMLVTMVDADGIFIDCNDRMKDLTGYSKDEIIGESFRKLLHPSFYEKGQNHLDKIIQNDSFQNVEYQFVKKDGDIIDVSIDSTPLRDKEGKFLHAFCFVEDTTERKKSQLVLKEIAEELKKSNEELEQFAYVASHDLQEPLRVVSSYCQLIRDKTEQSYYEDEEVDKYFSYIIDATDRMKKLIKELLDFSRVGKKDRPFEQIDLKTVLAEITADFELYIKETNATIVIEDDLPLITGIRFRVKQLLSNLISNALKFRSDKAPIIRIGCCPEDNAWLFYISDNGIGIDPKYFDRIFGIFKRLYSRDEYHGTGIGLALCKRIVETHGGKIWVDSGVNKGVTIYFTMAKHIELDNWQAVCKK